MRIKLIMLLALLLVSCGKVPFLIPYKIDIHQGNYVTPEMREKLKLGMSRQQVRYVLGTPLIEDAFHGNRWDYYYSHERGGRVVEKQRLALYFEGDKLVNIEEGAKFVPEPENKPVVTTPE